MYESVSVAIVWVELAMQLFLVCCVCFYHSVLLIFFFQAEDGIRDLVRSRGLGDVYKRQCVDFPQHARQGLRAAIPSRDSHWPEARSVRASRTVPQS